ncbi:MAG: hypothetical protein VX988_03085 [Planctomycetota bacterium]|nr:hypothetical protein [Planctomycetota bacterium]
MRINSIRTSVWAMTLCVIFGGCSAEETPADPSLAAAQDQPGNSPNASAGDEGKKDGDADDGNNAADTDPPPKKRAGPSDEEITQLFKDAGVDGGFRRRGDGLSVLAVVGDGQEDAAFEKLFAAIPQTTSITLDYNPDAFLQRPVVSVAGLSQLSKLSSLIARRVTIDPVTLGSLQNLKKLDLTRSQVSDELLAQIATLKKLQQLNLSNTDITDESLVKLTGMKNLVLLNLSNTAVTVSAAKTLRKSIAYLKIVVSKSREPEPEPAAETQPPPEPKDDPDPPPEPE